MTGFRHLRRISGVISKFIAPQKIRVTHLRFSSQILQGKTVRIGCACGFWGDTAVAAPQLIYGTKLDYLVFDYLSEITMSLLISAKHKYPNLGYAPDFVQICMAPFIKDIKSKGIKVISNAGGVNPQACADALKQICASVGVEMNIAVVTGDDLMPKSKELMNSSITDMDSGDQFPKTVHSMNAYLGAGPIARALDLGADIVITGRCVDSALVLGPLLHNFQWNMNDFDHLAAGSLAGHLIECGAQVTGGIFTDWKTVPDWDHIGFPVVECSSNGDFIVTKPKGTGGLINEATVSEQLVYEIGDPAHYFLPDVVCDFTQVQLDEINSVTDEAAVFVTGAKGKPPTSQYKSSATYADGYRSTAVAIIRGPNTKQKGEKTADQIIKRCRRIFKQLNLEDFSRVHVEVLGTEQSYGPMTNLPNGSRESVLWLAVHHHQKKALEFFSKEIAPAGTGMAPGLTGLVGGRPRVSPILRLFSFMYPKKDIEIDIFLNGNHVEKFEPQDIPVAEYPKAKEQNVVDEVIVQTGNKSYRLEDLAYTRSGDKGNMCNIGVIARHPAILPYLRQQLTSDAVQKYFSHLFDDPSNASVQRYYVPGIHGMNFVLPESLGGGGVASLRSDPQGKAYGQMLLDFIVKDVPDMDQYLKEIK
ncbi:uncharacterized protein LOC134696988 isoform X1 [Mytilus trossulus]|uniref:uncharacterized protein LOC134696988 isoform X1 n=1 Tax=Mytilus trossulus TaxID=6551 RepID=UPI0030065339